MRRLTDEQATLEFEEAGRAAAGVLATLLASVGYKDVYTHRPSALYAPEPIVIQVGAWQREARLADDEGERGLVRLDVTVVRECWSVAEALAYRIERSLRKGALRGFGEGWHVRMAGIDTELPRCKGQDRSGRWIWGFEVWMTIARDV